MSGENNPGMNVIEMLAEARAAEKDQALVYRSLASRAEDAGDDALAQRFHELHADEQHHVSRLTARLLELQSLPQELSNRPSVVPPLEDWEQQVRTREEEEVRRYSEFLDADLDPVTRRLVEEILSVEENHLAELGGKWTMA